MIKWPWNAGANTPLANYPWEEALAIPLLSTLTPRELQKLTLIASKFLQLKRIVPLQDLYITPLIEARIALLFSLPVLELSIDWLDGFHEILLYPEPFIYHEEWQDDIGLVHAGPMVQAGQCPAQGPVILNLMDVKDSFDLSGYNLIIHETAHKLDMRNAGVASGVPPIALKDVAQWEHDLHAAMASIQDEIDVVGEGATSLDAYAASEPAECFAVLSEYFFSAPELLAERFPEMYAHFKSFYRQDPLERQRQSLEQDTHFSHLS